MFKITFWGVRGSLPCATDEYIDYGGHTCCVSIETKDSLLILDAGSGLFSLGEQIVSRNVGSATLLLSHAHLDHIMGLPFFEPLWQEGFLLNIYAGNLIKAGGLATLLSQHLNHPFFPGSLIEMAKAQIFLHDISSGAYWSVKDNIRVSTIALNHPGGSTGYRIEHQGVSLCYITDTEHTAGKHDQEILSFIQNADCLIYDTMYTEDEFKEKKGWGHSTWKEGLYLAKHGNIRNYIAYHHSPFHKDCDLNDIESHLKSEMPTACLARQGMILEL